MTENFTIIDDFFLNQPPKRRAHIAKRKNQNVVEEFLNTIKNIVSPPGHPSPSQHLENETDKGLDFKIPGVKNKIAPNFGNNQDLQLIYLGTKW